MRADVAPTATPARKRSVPAGVMKRVREEKERVQKWTVFREPLVVEEKLYDRDGKECGYALLIDRDTAKHTNAVVVFDDARGGPYAYCADCGRSDCAGALYAIEQFVLSYVPPPKPRAGNAGDPGWEIRLTDDALPF